jgi:tryptophanyl-tRNA synthetase
VIDGVSYGALKTRVAERVVEALAPIRGRYAQIREDAGELDALLDRSANEAREMAEQTMVDVRKAVGVC